MAAAAADNVDRFGIGLRDEFIPELLAEPEAVDTIEVLADSLFGAPRSRLDALRLAGEQAQITLHGVGMGLSGSEGVPQKRLDAMARLMDALQADIWSEHLAFVRKDGMEIGHMAAPPRNQESIEHTLANLRRAKRTIGSLPLLENIATLTEPPGSEMSEIEWLTQIAAESESALLLDLHNLYANALNFGWELGSGLRALCNTPVRMIHISGGRMIEAFGTSRLLDDHLHDPPTEVYDLLEETAALCPEPLCVILERDGRYPAFDALLTQIARARDAVRRGRERRVLSPDLSLRTAAAAGARRGETSRIEHLLARIFTDQESKNRFLADPAVFSAAHGLSLQSLPLELDRAGIEMAFQSYARKRAHKHG